MSPQSGNGNGAVDDRYVFRFLGSGGRAYTRRLYWQRLHVFLLRRQRILAAARIVPHCDMLFAMYLVLKRKGKAIHHQMLPQLPQPQERTSIVRIMDEITPYQTRALPAEVLDQAGLALQQAVVQTLSDYAAPVVNLSAVDQISPLGRPLGRPSRPAGGGLGMLGALTDDDVARVTLSFEVDRAISDKIDAITHASTAALPADRAMVLRRDLRSGLRERLYSDPQYLRFVQWVMMADGSFVSPVVREFIRFYYERIADRVSDLSRRGEFDPQFWQERLLSIIGEDEADVSRTRPYWEITVLGRLYRGDPPIQQFNPDDSGRSYEVDPDLDPAGVVLREVDGRLQRTKVRLRIMFAFDGNIECIRFVNEIPGRES